MDEKSKALSDLCVPPMIQRHPDAFLLTVFYLSPVLIDVKQARLKRAVPAVLLAHFKVITETKPPQTCIANTDRSSAIVRA